MALKCHFYADEQASNLPPSFPLCIILELKVSTSDGGRGRWQQSSQGSLPGFETRSLGLLRWPPHGPAPLLTPTSLPGCCRRHPVYALSPQGPAACLQGPRGAKGDTGNSSLQYSEPTTAPASLQPACRRKDGNSPTSLFLRPLLRLVSYDSHSVSYRDICLHKLINLVIIHHQVSFTSLTCECLKYVHMYRTCTDIKTIRWYLDTQTAPYSNISVLDKYFHENCGSEFAYTLQSYL